MQLPVEPVWWLETPDGSRRRLGAGGIVVGRGSDADVVVEDPTASRHHALLYLDAAGPRVVPLGTAPTTLSDEVLTAPRALEPGDAVGVPGLVLKVVCETDAPSPGRATWVLRRPGGELFGVAQQALAVGGATTDDLRIDGLPARAAIFHPASDALGVEAGCDAVDVEGETLAAGEVVSVRAGSKVSVGGELFRVLAGGEAADATTRSSAALLLSPKAVILTFLPRGGRLRLVIGQRDVTTYLSERRCDLAALLLSPPNPYTPGDYLPDEMVLPRVWPSREMDRTDLNVLVYRLRKDLLRAGLDGCSLIERVPRGTRFAVGDTTAVEVT